MSEPKPHSWRSIQVLHGQDTWPGPSNPAPLLYHRPSGGSHSQASLQQRSLPRFQTRRGFFLPAAAPSRKPSLPPPRQQPEAREAAAVPARDRLPPRAAPAFSGCSGPSASPPTPGPSLPRCYCPVAPPRRASAPAAVPILRRPPHHRCASTRLLFRPRWPLPPPALGSRGCSHSCPSRPAALPALAPSAPRPPRALGPALRGRGGRGRNSEQPPPPASPRLTLQGLEDRLRHLGAAAATRARSPAARALWEPRRRRRERGRQGAPGSRR